MPTRRTRRRDAEWLDFFPLGQEGLDYETDAALASPSALVVGENVRPEDGLLARRAGARKIYQFSDSTASRTFGADTIYATIPAGPLSTIPAGSWVLNLHFTAVRPSGGNTAYILSSRVDGQSYHILSLTISDAGVPTLSWTKDSDASSVSIAMSAVSAGAAVHLTAVFDAALGTFTTYVDGASDGTPVTGISTTEQPKQSSATAWHVGVHYNPATSSVVANTHFDGKVDGFCFQSLRGQRIASGSPTPLSAILKHSLRQWPAPQMRSVLACYDFDDGATSMTDRSRFENDGTITGTPTSTAAVALPSIVTNHIGRVQFTNDRIANVAGIGGALVYEDLVPATS
ncbi:MAG: LamG-like jellyroll fold domain-containing protein [Dehalococcoidia bacterium]